jgi:hypothetical protein
MTDSQIIKPLLADYIPQSGDVLGSGFGARAEVQSIEDGEVRYVVYHGSKFFDWCRLPVAEFAEMARRDAISVARETKVDC